MENAITIVKEMIKPELIVLIPVLYFVGMGIRQTNKIKNEYIPVILGVIGVIISAIWVFANMDGTSGKEIATAIFAAITQGILTAGASVYINQLIKQQKYIKNDSTGTGETTTGNSGDNMEE